MTGIRLIVGLGNPGPEHEQDRHNAGFWFVQALAQAQGASLAREAKFFGAVTKAQLGARPFWLLCPQTYMNRSGQAVAALAGFYRIAPEEILVVHDELDLLPGQLRIKRGGGSAGHNGLKDISARLGTPDYWRLRVGIGHPRTLQLNQPVVDFVLHRPAREEQQAIDDSIAQALRCVPELLDGHFEAATMKLHTRPGGKRGTD